MVALTKAVTGCNPSSLQLLLMRGPSTVLVGSTQTLPCSSEGAPRRFIMCLCLLRVAAIPSTVWYSVFLLAGAGAEGAFSCLLCWEVPTVAVCFHVSLFSHSGTWKVPPRCMGLDRGRFWLLAPLLACTRISVLSEDIFPMSHLETSSACLAVTLDCSVTSDPSVYTNCRVLSE